MSPVPARVHTAGNPLPIRSLSGSSRDVHPAFALLAWAVITLWPGFARAETWDVTSFQVVAVEPAGLVESLETQNPVVDHIGAMGEQFWENFMRVMRNDSFDIDGPGYEFLATVAPSPELDSVVFEIEQTLEEAARMLQEMGFQEPALEPVIRLPNGPRAFRVYLIKGLDDAAGDYHPNFCEDRWRERVIRLDYRHIIERYTDGNPTGRLTTFGAFVVVHELMHAVQFASSLFQGCEPSGSGVRPTYPGSWIVEGTPDAVAWDIVGRLPRYNLLAYTELNSRNMKHVWGARPYDRRLPVPTVETEPAIIGAYRSSSFWSYLAEYEAMQGRPSVPGINPRSWSYLVRLLATRPPNWDCYWADAPCKNEIAWLDEQLRLLFHQPLRDLFARFAQAYAFYGDFRSRAQPRSDIKWLEASFPARGEQPSCPKVHLGPDGEDRQVVEEITDFKPLSMLCRRVVPSGFPEGLVVVAVTAEMLTHIEQPVLGQLTAINTDGDERVSRASVVQPTGERQRASWEFEFPAVVGETHVNGSVFLLTNAADDAEFTAGLSRADGTGFRLIFTVLDVVPYAVMSIGGDATDDGTDYDFEAELVPELSATHFGLFYDPAHARGRCQVHLEMTSEGNDLLQIGGLFSPPLRTGDYPFVFTPGTDPVEDTLGATLWWNSGPDFGGGIYNQFQGRSGTLSLTRVSPWAIEGEFSISFSKSDDQVDVTGRFRLPPGLPLLGDVFGSFEHDHPCLAPPEETAMAGGPGPPGPSPQPGDESPAAPPGDGAPEGGDAPVPGAGADGGQGDGTSPPMLDFQEEAGSGIHSDAQPVSGRVTPERTNLRSPAFKLTLALPVEELSGCAFSQADQMGYVELLGMARPDQGRMMVDITGATLGLDASAGHFLLELGLDTGAIAVRADGEGSVAIQAMAPGTVRVEVTGGMLDFSINESEFLCEGLLDFSLLLTTGP